MRILITNIQLDHRTGTEIVVRDLDAALRRRGHDVCVYTEWPGLMSEEIERHGGRVVTALADVPFVPDVIHGHHHTTTMSAVTHFPSTPVVFVCHSRDFWMDMSYGVPSVYRWVAVDLNCRERLLAEGVPQESIEVITNAVDLDRMTMVSHREPGPRRAAIFGNNATDDGFVEHIRTACGRLGIPLDEFGSGLGRSLTSPETTLGNYDVVFAKARCAIEALAAGCSVIAIDRAGYGGLVTFAEIDDLLDWNIGDRCLQRRHDADAIVADLQRIDVDDAAMVTRRVRERCNLDNAAQRFEQIYREAIDRRPPDDAPQESPHRALAEFATELESRIRTGDARWDVPQFPAAAARAVRISAGQRDLLLEPMQEITVDVQVDNDSRETLSSADSAPVMLSYHWIDRPSGNIVAHDGVRTPFSAPVGPRTTHRQAMTVVAPAHEGNYLLRVTMVQESVMWFSELSEPVFDDVSVRVAAAGMWHLSDLAALAGLDHREPDVAVATLGFVSTPLDAMLTFAESAKFLDAAISAGSHAVIVPRSLRGNVPATVGALLADQPGAAFWQLHERLLNTTGFYGRDEPTSIHPSAIVDPSARIDPCNVRIGPGTEVGPGCVITGRAEVGENVRIDSGTIIGAAGFQTTHVEGKLVDFSHAGAVVIGDDVRIFSNATIARGLFRQRTILERSCRVGNNAVISHNTRVGAASTIGHGAVINGNVDIGREVWVGPGACVANNVRLGDGGRIDLGATVIGNLRSGEHVGGPPAIDHRAVLREVASWRRRGRRT